MVGYYNLKSLIKAIRACRTQAEERALIQKESASIRSALKEEDPIQRYHLVAKVLYLNLLGWPVGWASIPALALIASPRHSDKRLGHLAVSLLLDDSSELLTLLTNSLKNDMNHSSQYVCGLALNTFANIAGEEMSRDLADEIEKLLGSANSYLRRKAALCALRIVRRVPDLTDHFVNRAKALLQDRNHGVLVSGVTLAIAMCQADEQILEEFRKATPLLVRHLKTLVSATGSSMEHDVSGHCDPFLQCKILQLLRLLGEGSASASEAMNDVLAQVATNTDSSRTVGGAILYETVSTILAIEADEALRVMAVNLLGKFLLKDNNFKYVALNTLNRVALTDPAVQRHRDAVLHSLSDADISIRRRALELSYALTNEQNVKIITRELLAFLGSPDNNEFKQGATAQICLAMERYAPDKRYHIDTVLRVLEIAGSYTGETIIAAFIRLVCHTSELQGYVAQRLFADLRKDLSQEGLVISGVWVLGEFADILLQERSALPDGTVISDEAIVDLLEAILHSPYATPIVRSFTLTSLAKLVARISEVEVSHSSSQQDRIREILAGYADSPDLELQTRSLEFGNLFTRSDLAGGVLEHMPLPEVRSTIMGTVPEKKSVGSTRKDKDSLVDLMGDENDAASSAQTLAGPAAHDLLADIFGTGSGSPATMPQVSNNGSKARSGIDDIMGLFGNSGTFSMPTANGSASVAPVASSNQTVSASPVASAPKASSLTSYEAYNRNGLHLTLTPKTSSNAPGQVQILARFRATETDLSAVVFQAAVPKSQQLTMLAMSNGDVKMGATETQQLRIVAPPSSSIRLRLRISFSKDGQQVTDQQDFTFPPLW